MTMNIKPQNREEWLHKYAAILCDEILDEATQLPRPLYRVSMTAPKESKALQTVAGECWNPKASADNHAEIFITAKYDSDDSIAILSTLLHELIHAYDKNQNAHNTTFAKYCLASGLVGGPTNKSKASFTATVPSPDLTAYLTDLINTEWLGPIPHAKLDASQSGKPKQKNRQLLVQCDTCAFKFRASKTTIESITHWECLACTSGTLNAQ